MDDISRSPALMPHVRLGVRGLPNLTSSMVSGGLYVLLAETAPTRFPLLAGSLGTALKDGRRCSVIVASNPEQFIQRLEAIDRLPLRSALASGQCQLLCAQDEFTRKMFRFGAERFVQELEQFDVVEDSYLIFDQADELLSLHDVSLARQQAEVLSQWLQQHRVTALLIFLRTDEHVGVLNSLMDSLTGIVRLGGDLDGLRLSFDYWQSPEGTVSSRGFQMRSLDNQLYEAFEKSSADVAASGQMPDELPPKEDPSFFYMDPDLGSLASQVLGEWHLVDTLVSMMHATRNRRGATVIFCYDQQTQLRPLAEAVHTLRINLGRYAKIVVQEKNASLRYQNEALLLRLGINLVIHRDVPVGRLPLLLGSLAGQVFNREVDVDFDAALASVTPPRISGYQPPKHFGREVEGLIGRAVTLDIPYALIIGRPQLGQNMIDILGSVRMSRSGDLLTADNESCYLFLYACQQSVVLSTLERMLQQQADAVFQDIRFLVKSDEVRLELAGLQHKVETGQAIDYSDQLPEPEPVASSVSQTIAVSSKDQVRESVGDIAQAFPAVREQAGLAKDLDSSDVTSLYHFGKSKAAVYGKDSVPRAQRKAAKSL